MRTSKPQPLRLAQGYWSGGCSGLLLNHARYDAAGRVKTQTLPDGKTIAFTYDVNGNVKTLTPPDKPAHTFEYTPIDLTDWYQAPAVPGGGTNKTDYTWDADRFLTRVARPDSLSIINKPDSAGRLSKVTVAAGDYNITYNPAKGTLDVLGAPGGIGLNYVYDGFLQTSENWSGGPAGAVGHGYDNDFRPASLSVNGANSLTFGYDKDSLPTSAGSLTITRDPATGLLSGSTLGSVVDSLGYTSDFGELNQYTASSSGNSIFSYAITARDKLGRITQKTETTHGVTTTLDYSYDARSRLYQVKGNGVVQESYTYDGNGNRLTANGVSATYDDQDRLIRYDQTTYTYTANGELSTATTAGKTTTYTYDELGNLKSVARPGLPLIEYITDGQNRRIGKRVGGVPVKGWIYEDGLRPIAETDGAGAIVSRFVYSGDANAPAYMIQLGVPYRILTDQVGSVRLVVGVDSGAAVQTITYDSFGSIVADSLPGLQPFGFGGGLYDPDTALVRFGARDYDPRVGRWTAKDSAIYAGASVNLFEYAMSDPIQLVDVNGLSPRATSGREEHDSGNHGIVGTMKDTGSGLTNFAVWLYVYSPMAKAEKLSFVAYANIAGQLGATVGEVCLLPVRAIAGATGYDLGQIQNNTLWEIVQDAFNRVYEHIWEPPIVIPPM